MKDEALSDTPILGGKPTETSDEPDTSYQDHFLQIQSDLSSSTEVSWGTVIEEGRQGVWLVGPVEEGKREAVRKAWGLHPVVQGLAGDGVIQWKEGTVVTLTLIEGELMKPEIAQCCILSSAQVLFTSLPSVYLLSQFAKVAEISNFSPAQLHAPGGLLLLLILTITKDAKEFIKRLSQESQSLEEWARKLHVSEGIEFLQRINLAKQQIYKSHERICSKAQVLSDVAKSVVCMLEVKQQIEAVMGDFEVMNTVVENCEKQLALAKMLYMGKIVIARSELSEQLDRMFRFFSRLELCGAVVNVIGNLHGMNVTVPFQDEDNLIPFYGIVSLALFVFVFIQVII
jgi:hypothetical protein